jgi:hypothetical protein
MSASDQFALDPSGHAAYIGGLLLLCMQLEVTALGVRRRIGTKDANIHVIGVYGRCSGVLRFEAPRGPVTKAA